jgi:hypothetical protein
LEGYGREPERKSRANTTRIVANRLAKNTPMTDIQWDELRESLSHLSFLYATQDHGRGWDYTPPDTRLVYSVGRANADDRAEQVTWMMRDGAAMVLGWWKALRKEVPGVLPLRAVLDSRITDLILIKALDITAWRHKHGAWRNISEAEKWMYVKA